MWENPPISVVVQWCSKLKQVEFLSENIEATRRTKRNRLSIKTHCFCEDILMYFENWLVSDVIYILQDMSSKCSKGRMRNKLRKEKPIFGLFPTCNLKFSNPALSAWYRSFKNLTSLQTDWNHAISTIENAQQPPQRKGSTGIIRGDYWGRQSIIFRHRSSQT